MARAEFGGHQRRGTVRRVGLALWNIERDEDFRHHVQCKELRSASTPQPTQPRKEKKKERKPAFEGVVFWKGHVTFNKRED